MSHTDPFKTCISPACYYSHANVRHEAKLLLQPHDDTVTLQAHDCTPVVRSHFEDLAVVTAQAAAWVSAVAAASSPSVVHQTALQRHLHSSQIWRQAT